MQKQNSEINDAIVTLAVVLKDHNATCYVHL